MLEAADPSATAIEKADQGLRQAGLPDIDPFWVQWGYFKERSTTPRKIAVKQVSKKGPKS